MSETRMRVARRSFLAKAGAGAAGIGATLGSASFAGAQSAPAERGRWQPARHAQDDWLDEIPGQHRLFYDTTTVAGLGQAMFYANNYYAANRTGYGLDGSALAVVICMRHESTAFGYDDAMWAKYGRPLAGRIGFADPKSGQPPTANLYRVAGYEGTLRNNGITLDNLIKNGAHFAVCQMATRANATAVARQTGGSVEDIYKELASNLIPNAHLVPAGIVTLNRAQERGYAFAITE